MRILFILSYFPGISQLADCVWRDYWCSSFTTVYAHKMFSKYFTDDNLEINYYGNAIVAINFLQRLVLYELHEEEFEYWDPDYQCVISISAHKPLYELNIFIPHIRKNRHPFKTRIPK